MTLRMLDTNMVSHILRRGNPSVGERARKALHSNLCVSAVTFAEISFGLIWRPDATKLAAITQAFFTTVEVLAWTRETAATYGQVRAALQRSGKSLAAMDMMIASHAVAVGAILVTADRAFLHVPELSIEDWTRV